jgi:hypothetical protein
MNAPVWHGNEGVRVDAVPEPTFADPTAGGAA